MKINIVYVHKSKTKNKFGENTQASLWLILNLSPAYSVVNYSARGYMEQDILGEGKQV